MTEYELVDAWLTHWVVAMSVFVAFLSATSALVVVANLKGHTLPKPVYRLVVYLYSVAAVFFILLFVKVGESTINVRGQMHEAEIHWFNAVYEPQFVAPLILGLGAFVQVTLAIGSLWYLRSTRTR